MAISAVSGSVDTETACCRSAAGHTFLGLDFWTRKEGLDDQVRSLIVDRHQPDGKSRWSAPASFGTDWMRASKAMIDHATGEQADERLCDLHNDDDVEWRRHPRSVTPPTLTPGDMGRFWPEYSRRVAAFSR
jgi:hypothetical protein